MDVERQDEPVGAYPFLPTLTVYSPLWPTSDLMPPKHFLTSTFRVAYEEYFSPEQQRNAVDTLQAHIAEVRDGSEEQQRELGVLKPRDTTPEQIEQRLAAYLDKCYWQLAQFYRVRLADQVGLRRIFPYA